MTDLERDRIVGAFEECLEVDGGTTTHHDVFARIAVWDPHEYRFKRQWLAWIRVVGAELAERGIVRRELERTNGLAQWRYTWGPAW